MADCGATGSALDRTAQAFLPAGNGAAPNKAIASLMHHAAATSSKASSSASMASPMPLLAPSEIVLPHQQQSLRSPTAATAAAPTISQQQPHGVVTQPGPASLMPRMQAPHSRATSHHHHHHHPEQQLAAGSHMAMQMAQQQQQQYMIMVQQQQQLAMMQRQQQQQQQHLMAQKQQQALSLERWHEGLDEEARSALGEHLERLGDHNLGHEGVVQGVGMEELAAAWAEAEAEYEGLQLATDMGAAAVQEPNEQEYTFTNTKEELMKTYADDEGRNVDWMAEGMTHFEAGNLKEAIRSFETEIHCHDPDRAEAWRMLGLCHAENDQDREAIICLEQAVDRDPYSADALLALGVSYVNELNHARALENLKAWITHNPKYAGLEFPSNDLYGASSSTIPDDGTQESAFEEVQRLLLRALEFDPSDAADILQVLGVVYNVSRDYDAAIDSFRKAIDLRPDDYQLWNKLGATLANGNQSDKALSAYHKALQIKPKYARAWLNMAISHSNLNNYEEAARCYLQTLSLNPAAVHCWSYLRIALSCAEHWDLIPHAASQDLSAFAPHFDFVLYDQTAPTPDGLGSKN